MKWNCFDAEGNFLGIVCGDTAEGALAVAVATISDKVTRVETPGAHGFATMRDNKRVRLLDNINRSFVRRVLSPGIGYVLCLIDPDGPPTAVYGNVNKDTIDYFSKKLLEDGDTAAPFAGLPETPQ